MATRRLTTFSKFLITLLIVGGLFFGIRYLLNNTNIIKDNSSKNDVTEKKNDYKPDSNSETIKIGVVTWGGYAGGQYFNEGFEANANSRFLKDYGFNVEFKILDDFDASRAAFKNDDVNLLWATIDAFPTEVNALKDYDPVVVFQADWSRGGDAIVARRGINKVSDLKGKKIAVAELTPSHSFLIWLLEAGGLSINDVEIVKQANAIDAAEVFKSQQVDAAVVWSPDDEACLKAVAGARVLESTRSASNIIADIFMAKRGWVEANKEKVQQLYEGWMKGASEINASDNNKRKAAKILAENFAGFTEDDTYKAINNVRLTTHGDNINFFGLNPEYKGVTGNTLYTRMAKVYSDLGYIDENVPNWRLISYPGLVESTNLTGAPNAAEGQKEFTQITSQEGKKKEAVATKAVSIRFRTGEYRLDENAKYIIDKEFVDIAKAFANSRIRIEGNTDNVGSRSSNVALSQKRAESVRDYLVKEHNMPFNRFIVIGNGPDKPVASNDSEDGKSQNRRTDFELVGE
ncbi:MAG: phosphate ABC transporter substrate-binding/OmpA family protein [Saprospiraceae bacterium]